ncbi:MAG: YgiQ family radical SAM protein [Cellvibrionales bacterium]|nr:YgiQ family radical SAM protein [Cellvibrionales bacterium]
MSREEMDQLGWDSCDIIIVCGDAYVDHPSFGMAVIGRALEAQGFRVGIIAQPDWQSPDDFMKLGKPNLFFGVSAGNMDSMINHYTADLKLRHDDAYTPEGEAGKRPDRAVLVYSQRCREAYKDAPIIVGGIEASLRRIAHYDYWSDKVRRSAIVDAKADLLVYGNAERAIIEVAHRLARGDNVKDIQDIRGTVLVKQGLPSDWQAIDSTQLDTPKVIDPIISPYTDTSAASCDKKEEKTDEPQPIKMIGMMDNHSLNQKDKTYIRLPSFQQVKKDKVLYAHASRVFHLETNPGNARVLVQKQDKKEVWINPPPIPLTTEEMDWVFELPFTRLPHTSYGKAKIPAFDMIKHSVNIMRGCFGGCSFCSITEHEGRIIQNRSEESIIKEVEKIKNTSPTFTGIISDLGGPTANMWQMACKDKPTEESCRRLSCVHPNICKNLITDQKPLVSLYRKARAVDGVKKVFIASGLRYDLAVRTPEYVEELVTHHVGGYLKIAPEHTEDDPLSKMMKPGIGTYDAFKKMFEKYSKAAEKEQYLIPYFIAAHPGTSNKDMMNLALWLKRNGFRADQVQTFYPSPMANATTMYHTELNPLKKIGRETVKTARGLRQRRLHKAFLRYHDPKNWDLLREALKDLGREDLIGNKKNQLIPFPSRKGFQKPKHNPKARGRKFHTQHTGLPPRAHK